MNICLNVGIGCGKTECEDTALFNNISVSDKAIQIHSDAVHCIGVADGVGGNAGGRIASRYVAQEICQTDFSSMTQPDLQDFVFNINEKLIGNCNIKLSMFPVRINLLGCGGRVSGGEGGNLEPRTYAGLT